MRFELLKKTYDLWLKCKNKNYFIAGRRKIGVLSSCQSDFEFAGPKNTRIISTDFVVIIYHNWIKV